MRRVIVAKLKRGRRLREVAEDLMVPYSFVRQVAAESGAYYVGRQLDASQEREIRKLRERMASRYETSRESWGFRNHRWAASLGGYFLTWLPMAKRR